jgi:hypothetical protein
LNQTLEAIDICPADGNLNAIKNLVATYQFPAKIAAVHL